MLSHFTQSVLTRFKKQSPFKWGLFFTVFFITLFFIIALYTLIEKQYRQFPIRKLSWKYQQLLTTKKNYDVIVIGTSRLDRGIDTEWLTTQSQNNACKWSFFNASLPSMNAAEFKLFLNAIKANPHLKPQYIIYHPILADPLDMVDSYRRRFTNHISNADINFLHFRTLSNQELDYTQFLKNALISSFRMGALNEWVLKNRKGKYDLVLEQHMLRTHGFIALDDDAPIQKSKRHQTFLDKLPDWQKKVAQTKKTVQQWHPQNSSAPSAALLAYHQYLLKQIAKTGAKPIVIFPPLVEYYDQEIALYRKLLPSNQIYDFNFHEYPLFENADLWYDHGHLNKKGAGVFAKLVYNRLCRDTRAL